MLNPLIDEIFELLINKPVWQVHTLANELTHLTQFNNLDDDPQRNLFKRNFLVMNALYQLQQQLYPDKQLNIATLHIELIEEPSVNSLCKTDALRDYYLDWRHYDTSSDEIDTLLASFWCAFASRPTSAAARISAAEKQQLLIRWQLPTDYTMKELQKRWRQLALQHHPDKNGSDSEFKVIKHEYEQLKKNCSIRNN
ncbi:DNA-J related domain-containing protein [Pseudoalteromonas mariniglutinosa]|uniref:DNA-J related domain-containing protein n=1 Tax=Pseudoalteromonas mariniglutinosa TaxID=206042 RepID=UPI00384D0370